MSNPLAKKYRFLTLLKFTAPTIIMMVFMSLYTMVDGVFVSRFVGTTALSAVNIVYPVFSIVIALAIMLGTGGSAVVATQMGEKKEQEAHRSFSLIVLCGFLLGVLVMLLGFVFLEPLVWLLGANEATYAYCADYAFWMLMFAPMAMLQMLFQVFFVTAGKPVIGLVVTVAGGVANMVLDYLLIVPLGMGIAGAAIATGIGFSIPAIFGLVYFAVKRKGTLCFVKPGFSGRVLLESCANGSSEMVTNLSAAVTTYLFNIIMMSLIGEDGVAAITIVLYSQYLLTAVYLGYSSGVAPIISYNYGDSNFKQLHKVFRISVIFILTSSVVMFLTALLAAGGVVSVFAGDNPRVFELAKHGFLLFSVSYLFMGVNIFASSMFTAFSDGRVSATISFLRTFVFIVAAVLVMPQVMGVTGVWLAVPVAELLTLAVSLFYIIRLRSKYNYA